MKLEKIIIGLFFISFGYISGSLRREIMLKSELNGLHFDFLKSISYIDFSIGFIYPLCIFAFFSVLFRVSSSLFINEKIYYLNEIILLSMLPSFIFFSLNLLYSFNMTKQKLKLINLMKNDSIIPFLSFNTSLFLAELFFIFPSLVLFIFLQINKKASLLNSFFVSILPMLIIYSINNLI